MKRTFISRSDACKQLGVSYLGMAQQSVKTAKNLTVNGVYTYSFYGAPAKLSGHNACPGSTPECRAGCLFASGHTGMDIRSGRNIIVNSRIKKTRLFFEDPDFFLVWLFADIQAHKDKAEELKYSFSVRLNCTTDIDWEHAYYQGVNVFERFPTTTFYDYTKIASKFETKPYNYHLTFSYTGRYENVQACKQLLAAGYNIAVVFKNGMPERFLDHPVLNGDKTDYRPSDGFGHVVGLKFKHIANKKAEKYVLNSCFVVDTNQL